MSQLAPATTPKMAPSEIDDTKRYPPCIATTTWCTGSHAKAFAAPRESPTKPEIIAATRSALSRSKVRDIAIKSPSEETATASYTPALDSTKLSSNQLKFATPALSASVLIANRPQKLGLPPTGTGKGPLQHLRRRECNQVASRVGAPRRPH